MNKKLLNSTLEEYLKYYLKNEEIKNQKKKYDACNDNYINEILKIEIIEKINQLKCLKRKKFTYILDDNWKKKARKIKKEKKFPKHIY